jgi:hypothetical protein
MNHQRVHRLHGLEIDEVSLVDRPANQHGLVTITKRDEGGMATGIYDEQGVEYDLDELEPGMEAFDEQGTRLSIVDEDTATELEEQGYDIYDIEVPDDASELTDEGLSLASVGKAGGAAAITGGAHTAFQAGRTKATQLLGHMDGSRRKMELGALKGTMKARSAVQSRPIAAVAAGAGGAGAAGYGAGRLKKNFSGADLLQELSKAYTDADRNGVIAKAFQAVEAADSRAANAENIAKALQHRAEVEQYVELAKSYELPVDDLELGTVLHAIAKNAGLTDGQLDLVDRVFSAAGEAVYLEQGSAGLGGSPIFEQMSGLAYDVVGKAGGDLSAEQALVALLDSNPDAYTDYLREQ